MHIFLLPYLQSKNQPLITPRVEFQPLLIGLSPLSLPPDLCFAFVATFLTVVMIPFLGGKSAFFLTAEVGRGLRS